MPAPMRQGKYFKSRADKIFSLIPKPRCDSADELTDDEEGWDEAELEAGVNQLFQDIGDMSFDEGGDLFFGSEECTENANFPEPMEVECIPEEPTSGASLSSPPDCDLNLIAPTNSSIRTRAKKRTPTKPKVSIVPKKIKMKPLKMKWKKTKFRCSVTVPPSNFEEVHEEETETALSYFYKFFSEQCIDLIVEQTNLYSFQQTGVPINVDRFAIKAFIGIELLMGIINLPAITDYWSKRFRQGLIADVMSLKKFLKIRRFIHFANNEDMNEDPYYKIRPVAEIIRRNCTLIPPERKYSVDEMMVPYKGTKAGSQKQYMPKKPCKWGFKLFVRAGVSGMVYDFLLYCGGSTFNYIDFSPEEQAMPFSSQTVVALCKSIEDPPLRTIYCDNFFTSISLFIYLRRELGILALGTIRANRTSNAPVTPENDVKKMHRGWFEEICDNEKKIVLVQWLDSKPVLLVSSYVSVDPVGTIERWSKTERTRLPVQCPQIIGEYNTHMGGVDLSDMLIALYRSPLRSHRWYLSIFAQLLDICVANAWLTYRRHNETPQKKTKTSKKGAERARKDEEKSPDPSESLDHDEVRKKKKTARLGSKVYPLKEFRADIAEQLIRSVIATTSRKGISSAFISGKKKTSVSSSRQENPGPSKYTAEHLPCFTKKGKCRLVKIIKRFFRARSVTFDCASYLREIVSHLIIMGASDQYSKIMLPVFAKDILTMLGTFFVCVLKFV